MTSQGPGPGERPGHEHHTCLRAREEAAVALLRRREPSAETRAHLDVCPPCRDEFVELAALPGLLGVAGDTLRSDPPEPPRPHLLDRLLVEVDRRRRRRRVSIGLLAAAAAIAVVTAVALGARTLGPAGTGPVAGTTRTATGSATTTTQGALVVAKGWATNPASGADAVVSVRAEGAGSQVSVAVRGWPEGRPCRLIVHEADGGAHDVGTWSVDTRDESTYVEEVDLPPATIARIELVDDRTGRAMLDVPVKRT